MEMVKSAVQDAQVLEHVHLLLSSGPRGTGDVARLLHVSVPTASRTLAKLRVRLAREGMELVSVRSSAGWHYEIRGLEEALRRRWERSRLRKAAGMGGPWKPMAGKTEDEILYGGAP